MRPGKKGSLSLSLRIGCEKEVSGFYGSPERKCFSSNRRHLSYVWFNILCEMYSFEDFFFWVGGYNMKTCDCEIFMMVEYVVVYGVIVQCNVKVNGEKENSLGVLRCIVVFYLFSLKKEIIIHYKFKNI